VCRGPYDDLEVGDKTLDPYEAAYLAGGPKRTVEAALAALVQGGAVEIQPTSRKGLLTGSFERTMHPLESKVAKILSSSRGDIIQARRQSTSLTRETRDALVERGYVLPGSTALAVSWTSVLPLVLLLGLGLMKIQVGVSRDRPVGFLVIFCIFTALTILAFLYWKPRRTHRGDRVLGSLRSDHSALRYAARVPNPTLLAADVALAVALFGRETLDTGPLADLRQILAPPVSSTNGGGCGGGGCGGGGGGGCGGGGCGGCGS
jgi:uncharacterized protein (TIGR04222 family)